MSSQEQFLNVIDRDEAEARFRAALALVPLGIEQVSVADALGRVLAMDVVARVDVPSFDRSNFDGFAIRAADSFGATELAPCNVNLLAGTIDAGTVAKLEVRPGEAAAIATGGMVPRGADAILMVEHSEVRGASYEERGNSSLLAPLSSEHAELRHDELIIRKAATPGFGVAFAGNDIATGETVLRIGTPLTSRETGVLAAIGENEVAVWRRPRVAIISTGNELIAPGEPMRPPLVYDSNAQILADSVREIGGLPCSWGIIRDDSEALRQILHAALAESDVVLLSGGTSKGEGDLCYRVVAELTDPGIVVHGVALKPGKPICLAVSGGKPVVILPGFPTSAIFTFHEFVAPVICLLGGRRPELQDLISARMAVKANSEIGRTEYMLVSLVRSETGLVAPVVRGSPDPALAVARSGDRPQSAGQLVAYPMGKGSGSVTTFSRADGFVTIGRHTEIVEAGQQVQVRPIGRGLSIADLIVIGSHCVGLDYLLSKLQQLGVTSKLINVGSSAGLEAVRRGECDLAGIHLMDPQTGEYNRPFLTDDMVLVEGYGRLQGIVYRRGDTRFEDHSIDEIIATLRSPSPTRGGVKSLSRNSRGLAHFAESSEQNVPVPLSADRSGIGAKGEALNDCMMVNRNQGSGTRILIDRLLAGSRPSGYAIQPTTHNAVAAAVAQGRADWGLAIESVAHANDLGFLPYQDERYDFAVPKSRRTRPAVQAFVELLAAQSTREHLAQRGFRFGRREL